MATLFILPAFVDPEIGEWQHPSTRPTETGVFRVRPKASDPDWGPGWSHFAVDGIVEIEGKQVVGVWGKAYMEHGEIKTADEEWSVNQDRWWAGLAKPPILPVPVQGVVIVKKDLDNFLHPGVTIDNVVRYGDVYHGEITNDHGTFSVKIDVADCEDPAVQPSAAVESVPEDAAVEQAPVEDEEI